MNGHSPLLKEQGSSAMSTPGVFEPGLVGTRRYTNGVSYVSATRQVAAKDKATQVNDAGQQRQQSLWRESLAMVQQHVPFARKRVRSGDQIYQCGESFDTLYIVSTGLFKIINLAPDGREQHSGLFFKGDWLGFDGIPGGKHSCTAIAMDSGELWSIRYSTLLQVSAKEAFVMRLVLAAISAQLARNRDAYLSMGTLASDARVADFLLQWANSLAERGMRTDQINIHMSRAEIGSYLGLRLESISRAFHKLADRGVIRFNEKDRRDISITSTEALSQYIAASTEAAID